MKYSIKVLLFSVFGVLLAGSSMAQQESAPGDNLYQGIIPGDDLNILGSGYYNFPTGEFAKSTTKKASVMGLSEASAGFVSAPSTLVRPTPATTMYLSDEIPGGDTNCQVIPEHPVFVTVFDTDVFSMSGNGDVVEINVTASIAMLDDAVGGNDTVVLRCTVTQGVSSKPCSHTLQLPIVASVHDGAVFTAISSAYTGFAEVGTVQDTSVKIEYATSRGSSAFVCNSTMNVRYK